MWLIVGLGNPGAQYTATRHNLGFMVVGALAASYGIPLKKKTLGAHWGQGRLKGEAAVLAQPTTYMNQSGHAVAQLLHYFKLAPSDLVVIHDDLDLPFGRLKLSQGGGPGGHRGVLSIQDTIHTADFFRVKLGLGRPPPVMAAEDFVLSPFPREEWEAVASLLERGVQAVVTLLNDGLAAAQTRFHGEAEPIGGVP